jgi:hypothetical protein
MDAFMTSRGRRFLPLLAMRFTLPSLPIHARASCLTDRATLARTVFTGSGLSALVVYESQGGYEAFVLDR